MLAHSDYWELASCLPSVLPDAISHGEAVARARQLHPWCLHDCRGLGSIPASYSPPVPPLPHAVHKAQPLGIQAQCGLRAQLCTAEHLEFPLIPRPHPSLTDTWLPVGFGAQVEADVLISSLHLHPVDGAMASLLALCAFARSSTGHFI